MMTQQHPLSSCSRVLLVLAGLLYLIGAAADPLVHAGGTGSSVEWVQVEGSEQVPADGETPSHAEGPCLLCKVAGPVTLSLPAPEITVSTAVLLPALLSPSAPARTSRPYAPSQPRAPPHA